MTAFVEPMLAYAMKDDTVLSPGEWVAEEKYDGHRLCVAVAETVRAWSRNQIERILPHHIHAALDNLPSGVYDGELFVPGERSYGTATLENGDRLVLVLFDFTSLVGRDTVALRMTYDERRAALREIFASLKLEPAVQLAWTREVKNRDDVSALARQVWDRDGEGLILKRRASLYRPGKRTKDWLKIKQLRQAATTIVGFAAGKMGPQSVVILRDNEGNMTTVKWKNLALLSEIQGDPQKFIGRRVVIEYQERTPDGSYRHPRWDRWAEDHE